MAKAVIAYDKDLPEIPGRRPWEKPTSYLMKDDAAATGWREDTSGRRPTRLLLVPKIRLAVDAWREGGYQGASEVTRRLFEYWFDEDHEVPGFGVPFRYYFCQREAIETLVWLVEIAGQRDTQKLIQAHGSEKDYTLGECRTCYERGNLARAGGFRPVYPGRPRSRPEHRRGWEAEAGRGPSG